MNNTPTIKHGAIFHFDGLPGAPLHQSDYTDHTRTGGLLRIDAITFNGTLHVTRGTQDDNGTISFFGLQAETSLADAHAMITNNVWRPYRY